MIESTKSSHQTIRAFFAVDLPISIQNQIEKIILQLKQAHKRESIRWSKPHNLHVTLQFLAAVKTEDLPKLIANVRSEIETLSIFDFELIRLELFPTPYLPRIISMNISSQELLAEMSRSIGRGIVASGYEIEKRPFRGHLTLARLNRIKKSFSLSELNLPKLDPITVAEIVLYKSEPSREGSRYVPLERFTLK